MKYLVLILILTACAKNEQTNNYNYINEDTQEQCQIVEYKITEGVSVIDSCNSRIVIIPGELYDEQNYQDTETAEVHRKHGKKAKR